MAVKIRFFSGYRIMAVALGVYLLSSLDCVCRRLRRRPILCDFRTGVIICIHLPLSAVGFLLQGASDAESPSIASSRIKGDFPSRTKFLEGRKRIKI